MKPSIDDTNIHTVIINDALLVRMWDGGMEHFGQCCLDFVDRRTRAAVNLPPGYSIYPAVANLPGVFMSGGPLPSLEQSYGYTPDRIPAGAEKWVVPAGAYLTIVRDGTGIVTFKVPIGQHHRMLMEQVVEPVRGAVCVIGLAYSVQ